MRSIGRLRATKFTLSVPLAPPHGMEMQVAQCFAIRLSRSVDHTSDVRHGCSRCAGRLDVNIPDVSGATKERSQDRTAEGSERTPRPPLIWRRQFAAW